ncbi:hypothetical protein CORC01_10981 [Colletotrichum orchidophilum]|uniref:Uncharacterized protein n=1 Tax=Colletotrichum orchidophilum TaxID=1209926 RepID=A0A1G4AX91_9PEZI|nr:uncharacterized protein CORC01_10981 [Colletotrichum orchidophilum]OHE93754.1 hypothetical protein CORC01_10981 [Colletotrichum orchidophilum]
MLSQEPQSSENAISPTPQEPIRHREKQDDDELSQHRPETTQNVPKSEKDNTEASSAESSAQNPPLSSKDCVIKRFWSEQVSVVVDFETCRDHLGFRRVALNMWTALSSLGH